MMHLYNEERLLCLQYGRGAQPWIFWLKTRQKLLKDSTIANLMKFLERCCGASLGGPKTLKINVLRVFTMFNSIHM